MDKLIIILIFIGIYVYAVLRYIIFGVTSWDQIPLFITNKALSFSGLLYFALSPIVKYFTKRKDVKIYYLTGFIFICLHVIISLILLNKINYGKFYNESGTFKLDSGISMLAGTVAFIFLLYTNVVKKDSSIITNKLLYSILSILPLVHLFFMGYKGWFSYDSWPGGMPPITLLSFILYTLGLIFKNVKKL
ncbi:MAG: hypothetical protein N2490_03440 [Ignavibacteria bacterium]|nr:hypothetical protein [Ignavibacteria bacterium]